MAEIVAVPVDNTNEITGVWDTFVYLLSNYWWVLLLFVIIFGLAVAVYWIYKIKVENDKKRDNSAYHTAMNLRDSATMQAKAEWINCGYSLKNLLVLGLPIWRNEHSARIIDTDRNIIGYYRGHTKTQEGNVLFILYKTRSWFGFVEDRFMLYCPLNMKFNDVSVKNKDGSFNKVGDFASELIMWDVARDNTIMISCSTVTKQGMYYFVPNYVFIVNGKQAHLDLTVEIAKDISKKNFIVQLESDYSNMSRAMGKAIEINPQLRFDQKKPEKEKTIEDDNEQQ